MYRLSIVRVVQNPNYDKAKADEYDRGNMNGYVTQRSFDSLTMSPTFEDKALTVDLTDDEFKAIKKAVLETM